MHQNTNKNIDTKHKTDKIIVILIQQLIDWKFVHLSVVHSNICETKSKT